VAATDRAGRVGLAAQLAPDPADRAGLAATDLAGPVDRVDLAITDPADLAAPVDLVTTDLAGPVDRVDLVTTAPAALVVRAITDPAVPATTDPAGLERGTAMTTAATSTALRGETDPHPGVLASRRDRHGTGRFRRPVDRGTTVRSTTGATRKRLPGTRSSTSSASTSSEFGSRCKDSPHQTPASPIGEAGVAHLGVDYLPVPARPTTGDRLSRENLALRHVSQLSSPPWAGRPLAKSLCCLVGVAANWPPRCL
jgi:hypothetical protein